MNFLSKEEDSKNVEKNNLTIAANILHAKKNNTYPAYVSKHNSNHQKQVLFYLIANGEE